MFLSADEIRLELEASRLGIDPFLPALLKPASYVLRLGRDFRTWRKRRTPLVVWSPGAAQQHLRPQQQAEEVHLEPGMLVLASTLEKISIPDNLVAMIFPLSHLARFGVCVHMGASWVSPGFGQRSPTRLTLELASYNPSRLNLKSGVPVCHIVFARVAPTPSSDTLVSRSIYDGRESPSEPMLFEEFGSVLACDRSRQLRLQP